MPFGRTLTILLFVAVPICAQFPDEIVIGPAVSTVVSKELSLFRLSSRVHVPGDFFDIEADFASVSVFPDRHLSGRFGVSWASLVWIPPALLGKRIEWLQGVSIVLAGINCVLNPTASLGNSWMRGFVGWKNDIFIFNDFVWIFEPTVGCKFATPKMNSTNLSIRCGASFPALAPSGATGLEGVTNFNPRLFIDIDVYIIYAEIALSGK